MIRTKTLAEDPPKYFPGFEFKRTNPVGYLPAYICRPGRPLIKIDYKLLDKLCQLQCTAAEIAGFMGITHDRLYAHILLDTGIPFSQYWKEKAQGGRASLRRRQWVKAVEEGNTQMLIWLGKQYLEQRDKIDQAHTGADGGPIQLGYRYHIIQEIISGGPATREGLAEAWRNDVGRSGISPTEPSQSE